jgi:hypothetical protein
LWAVIFLTSGLLVGCAIVYGVEKPAMHYIMVATVGVLVAANLFLVLEVSPKEKAEHDDHHHGHAH